MRGFHVSAVLKSAAKDRKLLLLQRTYGRWHSASTAGNPFFPNTILRGTLNIMMTIVCHPGLKHLALPINLPLKFEARHSAPRAVALSGAVCSWGLQTNHYARVIDEQIPYSRSFCS